MPFIQNPYDVLLEAAQADLNNDTENKLTEEEVKTKLNDVEEVKESVVVTAEMVPVINVAGDYLVEMNAIGGYMKNNGIKSIEAALDNIAEANQVQEKTVGLLIESDDQVLAMLEKASKMSNKKAKGKVLDKIKKSTDLTDKLKKDGYKVKKKKGKCPECGKDPCVCKENDTPDDTSKTEPDTAE